MDTSHLVRPVLVPALVVLVGRRSAWPGGTFEPGDAQEAPIGPRV